MTGPITLSEEERIAAALEAAKKATPGPWVVNPFNARVDAFDGEGDSLIIPICELLWPTEERTEDETEANAILISAAPLLAAEVVRLSALLSRDQAPEFCECAEPELVCFESSHEECANCGRRTKETI